MYICVCMHVELVEGKLSDWHEWDKVKVIIKEMRKWEMT